MYDVFLSFRGETRASFVSHLYTTLRNAGLCVFRDDDEIQRGDHLSVSLLQAIKSSKIFVIVLSPNYANSRWCMQELENIMEIHRAMGVVAVPVFYKVDPSEVRNQKGKFGEAFKDLMSKKSVDDYTKKKWKMALLEVGGIAGFVIINSKNESEDIKNIVKHVNILLGGTKLFVTNHPVGVESRVQDAIDQLNIPQLKDVLLLGIWGMGGTGKTTIAKAIYNQIENKFASRSFLPNIREVWEQQTNQVALQQRLLDDIFETITMKIHSIESGKNILKERLPQKKVLVVLDDVDKLDQLNALCGSHEWFHPESIIIITTRNERLLKLHKVDHVHTIEKMNQSESLELFCWYAFKKASPEYNFSRLSRDIVAYSQGLPLALQILGSCLFDRGITEWESVIHKLKKIPNDEMQEKLRISFDSLNKSEKEIFLDIACFFIGMDRNDVMQILNCSGIFVGLEITVLVERSLVTVDDKNRLQMHDLLKYMGREITREESPNDPEERNRLWLDEEVLDILSKNKGTKAVKGLALMLSGKDIIRLKTKAFRKMNRLRLLQLSRVRLEGDFKYLRDLRWLCWHGFPSTHAPTEFQQESLVAIDLQYSKLKQIWKNSQKCLENLKILNLSHSWDLTETPDFSYFPNLEKLVLKDCPSLYTVSHTIGYLHKLLLINLEDCTGLLSLPRSIYKLKSLETLILSGCLQIDKLEEDLQMESLTTLIAANTAITKVSFSMMHRLEKLKILNLSHSHYLTETPDFSSLPNLEELVLKNCTSLSVVSQTIGCLHKLLLINLEDCTGLIGLPRSIYKLKSLETFILSRCLMIGKLEEDLEQMDSLTSLIADATAIVTVPYSIVRLKSIEYISLCGFKGFSHDVFPSLVWSWMSPTNDMLYLVPMSPSMEFPDDSSWNLFSAEDLSKFKLRYLLVKFGSERQLTQFVAGILIDCRSQVHIPGSKNYLNSDLFIQMGTKCQVPNIVDDILNWSLKT